MAKKKRDWIKEIIGELDRILGPGWMRFADPVWFDKSHIYVLFDIDGFQWFAEPAAALGWLNKQPETTEAVLVKAIESEGEIFWE